VGTCGTREKRDIRVGLIGYPETVTKRLIEVDDDKLALVRALLGTTTLKSTVDAALDEVLALDRRRRALLAERDAKEGLADPERRQAAWR
jgi:Arc/MetJ family transcription regulator